LLQIQWFFDSKEIKRILTLRLQNEKSVYKKSAGGISTDRENTANAIFVTLMKLNGHITQSKVA
jgi:hypothetical protein